MDYRERLFYCYPEWDDVSGDDDMLKAKNLARKKIEEALFNEQRAYWDCSGINYRKSKKHLKVVSVVEATKAVLSENGVDASRFLKDWALAGKIGNNALIIDLAVIYLARHYITQRKKEYRVSCTWRFFGEVKVYADNEDDAFEKAEVATIPHRYSLEVDPFCSVEIDDISDPAEE